MSASPSVEQVKGEIARVHEDQAGSAETVIAGREAFQLAIEATYSAIVERATGRRVESFASRSVVPEAGTEPWACEVFRHGPVGGAAKR